jgi:hypothetical protein
MKKQDNLKLTNKIKSFGPKLKWLLFTELQDFKLTSDYIDFLLPEEKKDRADSSEKLENIVRDSLIREFSPEIQNKKSFNLLVDAVAHNLRKKLTK